MLSALEFSAAETAPEGVDAGEGAIVFAQRLAKAQSRASESTADRRVWQDSPWSPRQPANSAPRTAPRGPESAPGVSWDFSKTPVVPPGRAEAPSPGNGPGGIRSFVRDHRHSFSATIRRPAVASQSDSMVAQEPDPTTELEAPEAQVEVPAPGTATPVPAEGEGVYFPAALFPAIALPAQADKIVSAFGYKSSIDKKGPPPDPGEFGTTRPVYEFERPGPSATQAAGAFNVTGTIVANITYQVAGGNRTDIASDADSDITQANYPTVVSDLTPSPVAVNTRGLSLFKNQPPRSQFWAEDLTIKHEGFHADEDVKFGQDGVTVAQNWLNSKTAQSYDDVGNLLNGVTPRVVSTVDAAMALPGREIRAYADGAPDYLARAQAVKSKGDAKGYVPQPPAPPAPSPGGAPKSRVVTLHWAFR